MRLTEPEALLAGVIMIATGFTILGLIIGFAIGSIRSTSNRNSAWDAHEARAREIANNTQKPEFG